MPITIMELDSSSKEDNVTIVVGQNIILKIIEKPVSKNLLENGLVKKFISAKDLCKETIKNQLTDLFEKESEINNPDPHIDSFLSELDFLRKLKNIPTQQESTIEIDGIHIDRKEASDFIRLITQESISHRKTMEEKISKIDKEMVSINQRISKEIGCNVLVENTSIICPNCAALLSIEEFESSEKCARCQIEIKKEEAKNILIHKVDDKLREVWKSGLWFEAYMSRLLRKLDWRTWTNIYVMGSSGILHEIDFLAIKKGSVIIGECKTGKVTRNDVFNFCTKAGDIKSHISILAMINELPEPETREFIRKNPSIISLEHLCKDEEDNIIKELEKRLYF